MPEDLGIEVLGVVNGDGGLAGAASDGERVRLPASEPGEGLRQGKVGASCGETTTEVRRNSHGNFTNFRNTKMISLCFNSMLSSLSLFFVFF